MSKALLFAAVVCVFVIDSPAAFAKTDAECFAEARVGRELSGFNFEYNGLAYKHCDLDNIPYLVAKALLFIKDVSAQRFDGSNPFGQPTRLAGNPWKFFTDRVRTVVIDANTSSCRGQLAGFFRASGSLTICRKPDFLSRVEGPAQVLIHEAAHDVMDPRGVLATRHVNCKRSMYSVGNGISGCDESMNMSGSFAVETEFAIGVSRLTSLKPEVREAYRNLAKTNLASRFNVLTGDLKDYVALIRDSGQVDFYDGAKTTRVMNQIPSGQVAFNDGANGFRTESGPTSLIKRLRGQEIQCDLYQTKVICRSITDSKISREIKISGHTPMNIVEIDDADRLLGAVISKQIYIVTREGKMLGVPSRLELLKKAKGFDQVLPTTVIGMTTWRTAKLRPFALTLNQAGRVSILEYARDEVEAPGANSQPTRDIVGPFVWSPSLAKL